MFLTLTMHIQAGLLNPSPLSPLHQASNPKPQTPLLRPPVCVLSRPAYP